MACGNHTSLTLDKLPIRVGYWRANELSTVLKKCYPPKACVGSEKADQSIERRRQTEDLWCAKGGMVVTWTRTLHAYTLLLPKVGPTFCSAALARSRPGHYGVLCDSCIEAHYKNSEGLCAPCNDNTNSTSDREEVPYYMVEFISTSTFIIFLIVTCVHALASGRPLSLSVRYSRANRRCALVAGASGASTAVRGARPH